MFKIQIGNKCKQLPFTTIYIQDILDYIALNYVNKDDMIKLFFVFNNLAFNIGSNISLIDIGYSPDQLIEIKLLKPKKIIFNLQYFKYQYIIEIRSNYTCFDARSFFAKQYYTIPQNIIIKYQDQEVKDDAYLYYIIKDDNYNFDISAKEGYHIYYSYFENFQFICMKDDSKLIDLKITLEAYNAIFSNTLIYGDSINEYFNGSDQNSINNSELISLFNKIDVFDFTFQPKNEYKPFKISIKIETMKGPIIDKYEFQSSTNVYHIICLLEKKFGIERSLFKVYSNDCLLDLYDQIDQNVNNDLIIRMEKEDEILKIKIKGKLNRITIFTSINDMKMIDKFEDHNFGIVVNKHFILDESGDTLLIKYLNNTQDDNNATLVTLLKPRKSCHIRTFSELSSEGKIVKKTKFIVPDEMKMEQIAPVYFQRNFDSMKILKSSDFEIEFTDNTSRIIEYIFISELNSTKIGTVTINDSNARAMDLVSAIYKNIRLSFGLKKNKYDMFEVLLNTTKINFWTKITDILYDKENIIKIKGLFYQNDKQPKEKVIKIVNIENGQEYTIPYEILTVEEIINKINKKANEKAKLYMEYNELNPTDIPTIYSSQQKYLLYNIIPQRKTFTISNGTPLKFQINENEINFSHIASTINKIFQLDENQTSFSFLFKKKNIHLPKKFNAGSLPNNAEIQIRYSYEKLNSILFKFGNEKIRLTVNIDQSVEKVKLYLQQKLNIWDFSLNSISLVFYNFKFPRFAPFSAFKIPYSTVIKIETSETFLPIFVSTQEDLLNKKYNFSEGETIQNVKNHLKKQFDIDYEIDLRIEKNQQANDDLKLTRNMKIFCFCNQIPIKCEGSLGDDEIMISEIVSVEEANNYLKEILKENNVSIFIYNLKEKCFEKADSKKYLLNFKEPLFAHKFMPDIKILNYPFTIYSTEHISELNTIDFLKKKYISKIIQSLPQNFSLTQNGSEINLNKTLDNFIDSPINISFNKQAELNSKLKQQTQKPKSKPKYVRIPKVSVTPVSNDDDNNDKDKISTEIPRYKIQIPKKTSVKRYNTTGNYNNKYQYNSEDDNDDEKEDKLVDYKFKMGSENLFSLSFGNNSTILDMKKKIAEEKGLCDPSDIHPFVFDTFPENDKKIKSINPQNKEIIQIFIRPSYIVNQNEDDNEIKILDSEFAEIIFSNHGNSIGKGGQGLVYRVKNFENTFIQNKSTFWAVKVFNDKNIDHEKSFKRFINEYKILNILNHPNIVKSYGFFNGNEIYNPFILLEYCPKDLNQCAKQLSKIDIAGIIYEIVYAMKYVHSANLIHRDLKPSNILLDENNHVKICDFGLATFIDLNSEIIKSRSCDLITLNYVAPEVGVDDGYDEKVDVYSFGLILYFLIEGKVPNYYARLNPEQMKIPANANSLMRSLIEKCLSLDSKERPSFAQIEEIIIQNKFLLFDGIVDDIPYLKNQIGFSSIYEDE